MQFNEQFLSKALPDGFHWFNEPKQYTFGQGLCLVTDPETDFWQRTHYGFQRDNGHCLFVPLSGNFTATVAVTPTPSGQYDQCGIMVRLDRDHWIKVSTEYIDDSLSQLGAVVTNNGYSDWSTQDVGSETVERWYRVSRDGEDFLLESGDDGASWKQLRVAHLFGATNILEVGPYACSPVGAGFKCLFSRFEVGDSTWQG